MINIENLKLVKLREDGYYELDLELNIDDWKYLVNNNLAFSKTQLGIKSRKKWLYTEKAIELINKKYNLKEKPIFHRDMSIQDSDGSWSMPDDVFKDLYPEEYKQDRIWN